ncbi:MAG TPA: hypothetical protein VGO39_15630 [Gaiellaceae bacterium]|jgi:hypothetical protein|nr:hypothetical protein [Gaiellaceae bacterium]
MAFGDELLDRLAPARGWVADWPNVLERAGATPSRFVTKRRLVLALVALAAVLLPLAAVGAASDWWFLRFGGAPAPTSAPVIVKDGEWSGHPWQLVAYPSTTDGLCISVTPGASAHGGRGGALSCGPFAGGSRTPETKASPDMTITFLSGGGSPELPAYIAGPVIDKATTVEIRLGNGEVLRVPTFAGPESLGHVRFYATQLPAGAQQSSRMFLAPLRWVAGLDANGDVVACLVPDTAKDGISDLADCR